MTTLLDILQHATSQVLEGQSTLDAALSTLDTWIAEHAPHLSESERTAFSEAIDNQTTNDDASLVDSVLKLHATRLLYRYDVSHHESAAVTTDPGSPYEEARTRFTRALRGSEQGVNDARIDVAIANAHHLLGDTDGNRRWLDSALNALPDLANVDLVALAEAMPDLPMPQISRWKRAGLKLIGFPFERLAARNREDILAVARLQMNQVAILAHLLGMSLEAIRERQRARRAFRIVAHLVARYGGLPGLSPEEALDIASDLQRFEDEAARTLARHVRDACAALPPDDEAAAALRERAEALLAP